MIRRLGLVLASALLVVGISAGVAYADDCGKPHGNCGAGSCW